MPASSVRPCADSPLQCTQPAGFPAQNGWWARVVRGLRCAPTYKHLRRSDAGLEKWLNRIDVPPAIDGDHATLEILMRPEEFRNILKLGWSDLTDAADGMLTRIRLRHAEQLGVVSATVMEITRPIGRALIRHPANVGSAMITMASRGDPSSASVLGMKP